MKLPLFFLAAVCVLLSACSNHSASTEDPAADPLAAKLARNKAVVMAAERALATGNADSVLKDCAAGYTEYGDGQGKPVTNMDTIKAMFKEALEAFNLKGKDMTAFASGDSVLVTGTWSGNFSKPFMNRQPNGKTFSFADVDIFVMDKDGKILSHRATQTSAEMLKQLGLLTPVAK